jgi:hypothetical protein
MEKINQRNQRMIHDRGLQRGEKKTWIDKIVVCGGGSGERRSSPRGLRRWSGGIDEREKHMRGGEKELT